MPGLNEIASAGVKRLGNHFFQPLPTDVVRFWQDGEYSGGLQRSVEYDRLGWALMLRGLYTYETEDDLGVGGQKTTHRGFGIFDLHDGELRCYGIRVWTGASWDPLQELNHPLLWRSDVCAIQIDPVEGNARLRCVYRLLCPHQEGRSNKLGKETREAFDVFKELWGGKKMSSQHPTDLPAEAGWAVTYLTQFFERDWGPMRTRVGEQSKFVETATWETLSNEDCGENRKKCRKFDRIFSEQFQRILRKPNLLNIKELQKALHAAMDSGDPNSPPRKIGDLRKKELLHLAKLLPSVDKNDRLQALLKTGSRKKRKLICDRFKIHLAYLWKAIHPAVVAGFTLDLRAFEPGKPVRFQGEYGAFGRPAVGGKITFTRLDAFSFNQ